MTIERDFDVAFVANLALREKQVQQNYRPVIAVHKWFARRPGTLFRALLLSEYGGTPIRDSFFKSNHLEGINVADPFMGGGTPVLEANRLGCNVWGCDINPMARWIVDREMAELDVAAYRAAATKIRITLQDELGDLYKTRCLKCGSPDADAKYFLWVKTQRCRECGKTIDLTPGYVLAKNVRHPCYVLVCCGCGELNEAEALEKPGKCSQCKCALVVDGPARRGTCPCPACNTSNPYPDPEQGVPQHRLFAIEYSCDHCKSSHAGRFFKKPDSADLARYERASTQLRSVAPEPFPDELIRAGDESSRLLRWGYKRYLDLFNDRQLLALGTLCRIVDEMPHDEIRNALATNVSDLLRYQNMLCRYDAMALKSLDIFSVHGFPVGLLQCESNFPGIYSRTGKSIGSGGWSNIVEKYATAKEYCRKPFETDESTGRKLTVFTTGERIGAFGVNGRGPRKIKLLASDSALSKIPEGSLDIVITDPPYFANVQYAELMDFCYVWLRRFLTDDPTFRHRSTRRAAELTGNEDMGRDISHFAEGLSSVFQAMRRALKDGRPLAFTYHHNDIRAYYPLATALLDAGLVCSGSLPCPAEMGGSIHISGTASSIIDTVFVCRSTGVVMRSHIVETEQGLAALVAENVVGLQSGGVRPTQGDIRCVVYGHLVRMAIWRLKDRWNKSCATMAKLNAIEQEIRSFASVQGVLDNLSAVMESAPARQVMAAREEHEVYDCEAETVSF